MGMKTGASMAHLADALPISILMDAESMMKRIMSGISPIPEELIVSAPLMARIMPRLDSLKYATNWAAKNTRTIYIDRVLIESLMPFITSVSFLNFPEPTP